MPTSGRSRTSARWIAAAGTYAGEGDITHAASLDPVRQSFHGRTVELVARWGAMAMDEDCMRERPWRPSALLFPESQMQWLPRGDAPT